MRFGLILGRLAILKKKQDQRFSDPKAHNDKKDYRSTEKSKFVEKFVKQIRRINSSNKFVKQIRQKNCKFNLKMFRDPIQSNKSSFFSCFIFAQKIALCERKKNFDI